MKALSSGDLRRGRRSRALARGSSTLEILIAFAILTMALTAVILVFSSNQNIAVDTQTSDEALGLAQAGLESSRATAHANFYSLADSSTLEPSGPISYTRDINYKYVAPFIEQATSTVSWQESGRTLLVILSTLLTDVHGALTGDTCSPTLEGDWHAPLGPQNGANPGYGYYDYPSNDGTTGIDTAGGRAYITTDPSSSSRPDFYVIDVTNPNPPGNTLAKLGSFNTTYGLTGVQVSGNYAFVSADSVNAQLVILDKSNPANIVKVGQLDLTAAGDTAYGTTLYYDYSTHRVYLGLTTSSGKEFRVIDVSNPSAPSELGSGFEVDAKVNQIIVDGSTAYLATASSSQVIALDVSNPVAGVTLLRKFGDDSGGLLSGKSLYLSGNTLYFGRSGGGTNAFRYPQLYSLNKTDFAVNWAKRTATSHSNYDGVNRMLLRSNLLFVAADSSNGGFEIWDVSSPTSPPTRYDTTPLNISQGTTAGFDCEGNFVFIGESGNRALQIVGPTPAP